MSVTLPERAPALDWFGSPAQPLVGGVHRIAVLRANALGDFLVALPALEALKAAYPEAELVLLGLEWHRAFLEGRPGPVDRVVVLPALRGVSRPDHADAPAAAPEAFLDAIRAERLDLAVQLHGGGCHSNRFLRSLGARLTAGLRSPGAESLDRWVHYAYYQPEVLRYLEAVALVGARPVTLQARVALTPADLAEAGRVLPPGAGTLVVIHPGATDPRRRWPAAKFAWVADRLATAGARVVITGQDQERGLAAQLAGSVRQPVVDLVGRLSLGGLAGVLSRAALVIGNDTGPLHLARAVDTATVAVYWAGNLLTAGPVGRGRHRALISWQVECPVCGAGTDLPRCAHDESFVASVPGEDVLLEATELLTLSECLNIR